jgi:hypothetical protein
MDAIDPDASNGKKDEYPRSFAASARCAKDVETEKKV